MNQTVDWNEVRSLLEALYRSSDRLEAMFPGRKFTLDGHLVGSIGEVIAASMFDLDLMPASTTGHGALVPCGKRVEIKFTKGRSVVLRHEPEHLVVLRRQKGGVHVIFKGPGRLAWLAAENVQSNGQCDIPLRRLTELDRKVPAVERLVQVRPVPV